MSCRPSTSKLKRDDTRGYRNGKEIINIDALATPPKKKLDAVTANAIRAACRPCTPTVSILCRTSRREYRHMMALRNRALVEYMEDAFEKKVGKESRILYGLVDRKFNTIGPLQDTQCFIDACDKPTAYVASKHIAMVEDVTSGPLQPLHLVRILNPHLDALAFPLTNNMTTPISAFLTLRRNTWLRGSVLDAYISVLNEANARNGYKQILVWPSEYVKSKMCGDKTINSKTTFSIEASNIKDLTLTEIADSFAWQCFPLSDENHWILCLYSSTAKTFTIFDSLNGRERALSARLKKALITALSVRITFLHQNAPQQQDATMCGVCVARTADFLVAAATSGGDLNDVQYDTCLSVDAQYRLHMLYWILVYRNSRSKVWSSEGGIHCPIPLENFGDGDMAIGPDESFETLARGPRDEYSPEPTHHTRSPEPTHHTRSPEPTHHTRSPEPTHHTRSPEPTHHTRSHKSIPPTCPVCLKELPFLSSNSDFRVPFQGNEKAGMSKHVRTEHPDKPVWNALAKQDIEYEGKKRKKKKVGTLPMLVHCCLAGAARVIELPNSNTWVDDWNRVQSLLLLRLYFALSSMKDTPRFVYGWESFDAPGDSIDDQRTWLRREGINYFLCLKVAIVESTPSDAWMQLSAHQKRNLIQCFFLQFEGHRCCGILSSDSLPALPIPTLRRRKRSLQKKRKG